jgi:excisionase family DNA binding protein
MHDLEDRKTDTGYRKETTLADVLQELRELRALIAAPRMPEVPLSPEEFAKLMKVSVKTVRRWITAGQLAAFRAGKTVRISPVSAQRFLGKGVGR